MLAVIFNRLNMISELGTCGYHKMIGGGVSEFLIFVDKGCRIYYTVKSKQVIFLFCGGMKSKKNAQQNDIKRAKKLLLELD